MHHGLIDWLGGLLPCLCRVGELLLAGTHGHAAQGPGRDRSELVPGRAGSIDSVVVRARRAWTRSLGGTLAWLQW